MNSETGKHVLTPHEAFSLLDGVHSYFANEDVHLQGTHRAEILSDAMLREGFADLSHSVMWIHNVLKEFHRGNFQEVDSIAGSCRTVESFLESAKGTRFEKAAEDLMAPIRDLNELLVHHAIDWQQSAPVLADEKKAKFPQDLTMTEKLGIWQRQQSQEKTL